MLMTGRVHWEVVVGQRPLEINLKSHVRTRGRTLVCLDVTYAEPH